MIGGRPRRARRPPAALGAALLAAACLAACEGAGGTGDACVPGARICSDRLVLACNAAGTGYAPAGSCPPWTLCGGGVCLPVSDDAAAGDATPDTAVPPDTEPDTGPDTTVPPDTEPDTAPDTSVPADTEPDTAPDTSLPPDTEPDTAPDTSVAPDTAPDTAPDVGPPEEVPFTPSTHLMAYEMVPNITFKDDLRRIAWAPDGAFAIVLGAGGKVLRYDAAGGTLSLVGTVPGAAVDVEAAAEGAVFLVVTDEGSDAGALWRVEEDGGGGLALSEEAALPFGAGAAVVRHPSGSPWAVATRQKVDGGFYANRIWLWTPADGFGALQAWSGIGLSDLMWVQPSPLLYAGSEAIVTAGGPSGADSRTWVLASDELVSNGWSPGFGNAGRAAWRPGGDFGFALGWTSNKVYVFDGAWELGNMPQPTGMSGQGVAWKADGTRALVVGNVYATPLRAVVLEHRALGAAAYADAAWLDVSIQGFAEAPWFGKSSQQLLDVAWRPGTACAEGLIVGTDSGTSLSPTFGLAVRFHDPDDPDCAGP